MFGALCLCCTSYVTHSPSGGWVHLDGGGAIWQRCPCGWSGSEAVDLGCCPRCGSTKNLIDDHVAQPDRGDQRFAVGGGAAFGFPVVMLMSKAWDVSGFPPAIEVPVAALLQFEQTRTGNRARAVRRRFGISEVRYVQLLNRALDDPEAERLAPELVTRLKAERQAKRELRERACAGRIA